MWDKHRTKDDQREAERVVPTTAKLIMSEIRETQYDVSTHPSILDIATSNDQQIPNLLQFLQIMIQSTLKQRSIGQSIVQICKPRSSLLPIPFGLAVELDHVFGSKWLMEELSYLLFCSSYREVSKFKQSSLATEDYSDSFAQYVADNVDYDLCNLDGKKTFHGMGIIRATVNRNGIFGEEKLIKRQHLKPVGEVTKNKGRPIQQYIPTNESMTSTKTFKEIASLKLERSMPGNICT